MEPFARKTFPNFFDKNQQQMTEKHFNHENTQNAKDKGTKDIFYG